MHKYELEHILSFTATLGELEVIGPVPEGVRANLFVTGGEVTGPRISGRVRPAGGDWLTVGTDGVAIVDARLTFEVGRETLLYVAYGGVGDLGADGYERFLRGELPPVVPLRVVPRFRTADPGLLWISRPQCLGIGEFDAETSRASYDVYAVR